MKNLRNSGVSFNSSSVLPLFLRQLLGYFAASVIGLIVDSLGLFFLFQFFNFSIVSSSIFGFMLGTFAVYFTSKNLVFEGNESNEPKSEILLFALLGVVGLLLTAGVMHVGVNVMHLDYRLSKLCAAACGFSANFSLRKYFIFSAPRARNEIY